MPEQSTDHGPRADPPWVQGLNCPQDPANCECAQGPGQLAEILRDCRTNRGKSPYQLSFDLPQLFVFLRNLNCVFCRESLSDIAQLRRDIELEGANVVLFHMESEVEAAAKLQQFALADLSRVTDPERQVYRAFGLGCGSYQQLGPRVLWRALTAGFGSGWFGRTPAQWSQMPGVFLVYRGEVYRRFKHSTARDRPNYVSLAAFPLLRGLVTD